ncbi:hypothetical protein ACU635_50770 [[Actinomadura] parvosata]|uniref:hypothetical protein n=1 Tax=[Actinomadura] parvosata TaxID=1955412 RepID=UPI00406C1CD4
MKRADLDTITVLSAIRDHEGGAYGVLAERFPPKVVLAAFAREDRARRTEYGVAEHLPWLTAKGRATLRAAERQRITLTRVVQTCYACPSQWDAWDADGRYYYLRYRWGVGTVETQPGPDMNTWTDREPLASFEHGDDLSGTISLTDFMALAGLTLAPGAEVS